MQADKAIKRIADSEGDIELSIRQVLEGYLEEMNGPREFGKEMGRLTKDPDVSAAARSTLANAFMRLLGQFGDDEETGGGDLIDEEQTEIRLRQLREKQQKQ